MQPPQAVGIIPPFYSSKWVHALRQLTQQLHTHRFSRATTHRDAIFASCWSALSVAHPEVFQRWSAPVLSATRPSALGFLAAAHRDIEKRQWARALAALRYGQLRQVMNSDLVALAGAGTPPTTSSPDIAEEVVLSALLPSRWAAALQHCARLVATSSGPTGSRVREARTTTLITLYLAHPAFSQITLRPTMLWFESHTATLVRAVDPRVAAEFEASIRALRIPIEASLEKSFAAQRARAAALGEKNLDDEPLPFADYLSQKDWVELLEHATPPCRGRVIKAFKSAFQVGADDSRWHLARVDEALLREADAPPAPVRLRFVASPDLLNALIQCQMLHQPDDVSAAVQLLAECRTAGLLPERVLGNDGRSISVAALCVNKIMTMVSHVDKLPTWFVLGSTTLLGEATIGWTRESVTAAALAHARVGRWYKAIHLLKQIKWEDAHATEEKHPSEKAETRRPNPASPRLPINMAVMVASHLSSAPRELQLRSKLLAFVGAPNVWDEAREKMIRVRLGGGDSVLTQTAAYALSVLVALSTGPEVVRDLRRAWRQHFSASLSLDAWLAYVRHVGTWTAAIECLTACPHAPVTRELQAAIATAPSNILDHLRTTSDAQRSVLRTTAELTLAARQLQVRKALDAALYLARLRALRSHALVELATCIATIAAAGARHDPPLSREAQIDVALTVRKLHRTRTRLRHQELKRVVDIDHQLRMYAEDPAWLPVDMRTYRGVDEGVLVATDVSSMSSLTPWQLDATSSSESSPNDGRHGGNETAAEDAVQRLQFTHPLLYAMLLLQHLARSEYEHLPNSFSRLMLDAAAAQSSWVTALISLESRSFNQRLSVTDLVQALAASKGSWQRAIKLLANPRLEGRIWASPLWYEALLLCHNGASRIGRNATTWEKCCEIWGHHWGDPHHVPPAMGVSLAARLAHCGPLPAHLCVAVLLQATGALGIVTSPSTTGIGGESLQRAVRGVSHRLAARGHWVLALRLLTSPVPIVYTETAEELLQVVRRKQPDLEAQVRDMIRPKV